MRRPKARLHRRAFGRSAEGQAWFEMSLPPTPNVIKSGSGPDQNPHHYHKE
jgi:hypothetical protein